MRRSILMISLVAVTLVGCRGRQPSSSAPPAPSSANSQTNEPAPSGPFIVDKLAVVIPTGERGYEIRITPNIASLMVNNVVLNKGDCTTTTEFPKTIASGNYITVATSPGCNPVEVRVDTDHGAYTVKFSE